MPKPASPEIPVAPLGCALALQHRLPEPGSPDEALLPPLSPCWKAALPLLREFTSDAARPCQPVWEALIPFVEGPAPSLSRP
jgi:hypothetical protein